MIQVPMIDIQTEKTIENAVKDLIKFKPVKDGNIGLETLYELVNCNSRMIERVWLGNLKDKNELHLIIDEEGTFGQWSRGIKIKNKDGYEHQILGNSVFVKSTPDGDWIGWENEVEMADDIRDYIYSIKVFDLIEKQ